MKRILSLVLAAVLTVGCLAGCAAGDAMRGSETLQIVATIFPEYDWVRAVLGDNPANAELTLLLDSGVDLHSYQPTASDLLKLATCDLFVYVGGESDAWVEDALAEAVNPDMVVLNLLDLLGDRAREEEVVEGMEPEAEADEDEVEYDEHVWLSLRNAALFTSCISDALQTMDPDHAETYAANSAAYVDSLNALDAAYQAAVSAAPVQTLLFGDRFPFRYLTEDYGLGYYAAFVGCSAETEASFETITFLAQKVDALRLPAVLTIDGTDHRIAETIVQTTETKDQKILTLNSMQSTTGREVQNGVTYLAVMEQNLAVLTEALQGESA